jgi:hypothetical protein
MCDSWRLDNSGMWRYSLFYLFAYSLFNEAPSIYSVDWWAISVPNELEIRETKLPRSNFWNWNGVCLQVLSKIMRNYSDPASHKKFAQVTSRVHTSIGNIIAGSKLFCMMLCRSVDRNQSFGEKGWIRLRGKICPEDMARKFSETLVPLYQSIRRKTHQIVISWPVTWDLRHQASGIRHQAVLR